MDASLVAFAEPYLQMTCIDPATSDASVLAEFDRYYTEVHAPDVVRCNPGICRGYRYELADPDPRGAFGPRWLSIYEWRSRHDAQVFAVRAEAPDGSWRPDYLPEPPIWSAIGRGVRQWGRLMCRKIAESGPPLSAPAAILLEGFDLPADEAQRDACRSFVTIHQPRLSDRTARRRVTTYELESLGFRPNSGIDHPQYLSIHELVAGAAAPPGSADDAEPPGSSDLRRIAWRHHYRRISDCIEPGARHTARML